MEKPEKQDRCFTVGEKEAYNNICPNRRSVQMQKVCVMCVCVYQSKHLKNTAA